MLSGHVQHRLFKRSRHQSFPHGQAKEIGIGHLVCPCTRFENGPSAPASPP